MAVYSIKDLEKLSGIKAHTIRIWEQRYGIVLPQRTKTNIRYYQDNDLKKILNIALLNKNGIKISKIAQMSEQEIADKVAAISEINFEYNTQLDALTLSMIEMDEFKFDRIIRTNIRQLGFEKTMLDIIYPFLDKLGLLWLTGSINPVQESFMSNLIRQKIICAIDNEPLVVGPDVEKYLIYLPEGESQELSLLVMHYIVRSRRKQVIYLGQNITIEDLKDAYNINKPDYIFTMITESYAHQPVQRYIDRLSDSFPDCKILLSGYQVAVQNVTPSENTHILKSLDETIQFIDRSKS